MRLLDKESAPSLNALLTGENVPQLQRKACPHVRSTGAADAVTCLSLPVVKKNANTLIAATLQEAVDA